MTQLFKEFIPPQVADNLTRYASDQAAPEWDFAGLVDPHQKNIEALETIKKVATASIYSLVKPQTDI